MTKARAARLQQPPISGNKPTPAAGIVVPNGNVHLEPRDQAKLDEIVQSSLNAQANLEKARQDVEQQGGRLVGALEIILNGKGLDPAKHRWNWDGQHVSITEVVG